MSRLAKGRAFKVDQKEMKMRSKKYFDKLPENKEKKEKERVIKEAQERKDRINQYMKECKDRANTKGQKKKKGNCNREMAGGAI